MNPLSRLSSGAVVVGALSVNTRASLTAVCPDEECVSKCGSKGMFVAYQDFPVKIFCFSDIEEVKTKIRI